MFWMIIFWIFFSCLVVKFAQNKGRSGLIWFILSLFISPLISFMLLFLFKTKNRINCNWCGENIAKLALICPHCHISTKDLPPSTSFEPSIINKHHVIHPIGQYRFNVSNNSNIPYIKTFSKDIK